MLRDISPLGLVADEDVSNLCSPKGSIGADDRAVTEAPAAFSNR
jgi:hypothetical protein